MKTLITILMLCSLSLTACSRDWYRIYLVSKISAPQNFSYPLHGVPQATYVTGLTMNNAYIPRFERPKGAIFCRMEDYLTAKTKVWFKVGVK